MARPRPPRAAFTVIEALIAIALGMALCAVAASSFRLATQALSVANRLSSENGLLRLALSRSLDELDFWTTYDDPGVAAAQPLRASGRPFQPMTFDREDFQLDFTHSDDRTWWRGADYSLTSQRLGDYGLFAGTGDSRPSRRWYGTMLDGLYHGLGGYAAIDYLPANAVYSFTDDTHRVPSWIANPGSGPGRFCGAWVGCNERPRGLIGQVHDLGYCVTVNPAYVANAAQAVFSTGAPAAGPWSTTSLQDRTTSTVAFLPLHPAALPAVDIAVSHILKFGWPRFWNCATITMTSPVTGETTRLTQYLTATTLRGARRQRGLDRGAYVAAP